MIIVTKGKEVEMSEKVKLTVLGFSFNQTQSGTYGLVLSEEEGIRRLMIVVGAPEAQSIAFRLQHISPPRPLTHDLFGPIMDSFHITLNEVFIYEFIDGVFHSKLILTDGEQLVEIDSRTSDAIAIAIRTGSPIYTTEAIMQKLAVVIDDKELEAREHRDDDLKDSPYDFSLQSVEELEEQLKEALSKEDYELASILRDEITKKEIK